MRLADCKRVHQGEHVGDQQVEGVAAAGRLAAAVPALVVAQHAERAAKLARLLVPHGQIGRERVAQDEPGRAFRTVELIVDADAVGVDLHDEDFLQPARCRAVDRVCAWRKSCSNASSAAGACAGIMCTASISSNRAPGIVCANCSLIAGGRTLSKRPATTMVGLRMSLPRCVTLGCAIERLSAAKQTGSCAM